MILVRISQFGSATAAPVDTSKNSSRFLFASASASSWEDGRCQASTNRCCSLELCCNFGWLGIEFLQQPKKTSPHPERLVLRPRRSFFSGVPFAHSTAATCVRKSREVEINSIGAESLEGCLRPGDGRCPLGHKRKYRWTNDANSFACLLSEMPTRHPARLRLRRVREIGHRGPRFTLRLLRDTKIKRRSTWVTARWVAGIGRLGPYAYRALRHVNNLPSRSGYWTSMNVALIASVSRTV
jgi:hypothetical protein